MPGFAPVGSFAPAGEGVGAAVPAPLPSPLATPGPAVMSYIRSRPAAFRKLEDAQDSLMQDRAWIVRRVRQTGTLMGQPAYQQQVWGGVAGYLAKLSTPVERERRDPDKYEESVSFTLAIICDWPLEMSDFVMVESRGVQTVYRVTTDVQTRWTAFGNAFIRHCGVEVLAWDRAEIETISQAR